MRARICREAGCGALVHVSETHCPRHRRERRERKPFEGAARPNAEFYNSARWRNLRRKVLSATPHCVKCGVPHGEAALEAHHVAPPRGDEGLFFDEGNVVPVCGRCHRAITGREAGGRGRDR